MISFMDYILREFAVSTDWNGDNSYSALTATSDAILAFQTPTTLSLDVSSLSTANFATAYRLSTIGQVDGSVSYLYTTLPLGHIHSTTPTIPLQRLVHGYRDIKLPIKIGEEEERLLSMVNGRKPTLLHATLALPPPSTLTGLYARRIDPKTLLSILINSQTVTSPSLSGPPPATVLAHLQRDTGRYSIEALASTDSGLLGVKGLWNFGVSPTTAERQELNDDKDLSGIEGSPDIPITPLSLTKVSAYHTRLASKPSLLSAGAEFYYSPFSHVIGMSTGLRFTTLATHITPATTGAATQLFGSRPLAGASAALSNALLTPANVAHSSFPYTMTLTLTPLTGSLSSTYSVKPSPNLALSSCFNFNVYSWESQYVLGAEIWRKQSGLVPNPLISADGTTSWPENDPTAWARHRTQNWFSPAEKALKDERREREDENVLKVRIDDGWNIKALWTGRVKSLLVSAGVGVGPVPAGSGTLLAPRQNTATDEEGRRNRWTGNVGLSIAYST